MLWEKRFSTGCACAVRHWIVLSRSIRLDFSLPSPALTMNPSRHARCQLAFRRSALPVGTVLMLITPIGHARAPGLAISDNAYCAQAGISAPIVLVENGSMYAGNAGSAGMSFQFSSDNGAAGIGQYFTTPNTSFAVDERYSLMLPLKRHILCCNFFSLLGILPVGRHVPPPRRVIQEASYCHR